MARFARIKNDVYVGMLALAALATALGCVLLVLELNVYEWETAPNGPKLTAPTLPADEPAVGGPQAAN